jgi:hypothetical protein
LMIIQEWRDFKKVLNNPIEQSRVWHASRKSWRRSLLH